MYLPFSLQEFIHFLRSKSISLSASSRKAVFAQTKSVKIKLFRLL